MVTPIVHQTGCRRKLSTTANGFRADLRHRRLNAGMDVGF